LSFEWDSERWFDVLAAGSLLVGLLFGAYGMRRLRTRTATASLAST